MDHVDGFTVEETPSLRSPVVIIAFTGWSDTGTVTTDTARHLIEVYDAQRFLTVDAEEYYVFTDTRPTVKLDETGLRQLEWPKNEAYLARLPGEDHDLIIVSGVEPNLRWRTFAARLSAILADCKTSLVCTLVARPAATPHTRPIPVTGSSADPALAARYKLNPSMYQGPTGILGVIHDELRKFNTPLISLAAGVPHYLNVEENPPATTALLKALRPILGFQPPMGDLEDQGVRFMERVEEASRSDDQIGQYVRTLEEHYGEPNDVRPLPSGDLPNADDILRDIEDLLRGGKDS